MGAEQVLALALRFDITSAFPSTTPKLYLGSLVTGWCTGDPKMGAEQVLAFRFGITSAFPSVS